MFDFKKIFLSLIFSVILVVPTFSHGLYYLNHVGDDDICLIIGVTGENPQKDFSYLMGISFIDKENKPHRWWNYNFLRPNSYWEKVSGKWVFTGKNIDDEISTDLEDNGELLGYWYDPNHGKYFVGEVSPMTNTFGGIWLDNFDDVLDSFSTFAYMKYYALKTNNKVHLTKIDGSIWNNTNEIAHFMDSYSTSNYGSGFRYSYCTNMNIWSKLKMAGQYVYIKENSPAWRDLGHLSNDLPMGYFVVPKGSGSPMGSMSRKPDPEKVVSVCQIPVKRYSTLRIYNP